MRIYVKVSRDLSSEADKYLLSSTGLRLVPQQERQCYSRGISNSVATLLNLSISAGLLNLSLVPGLLNLSISAWST